MGIPAFYKWIIDKFPKSIENINNIGDIDNLYLDTNGY